MGGVQSTGYLVDGAAADGSDDPSAPDAPPPKFARGLRRARGRGSSRDSATTTAVQPCGAPGPRSRPEQSPSPSPSGSAAEPPAAAAKQKKRPEGARGTTKPSELPPTSSSSPSSSSSSSGRPAAAAAAAAGEEVEGRAPGEGKEAGEAAKAHPVCPAVFQLSRAPTAAAATTMAAQQHAMFGDLIPWGDPAWYRGEYTPYYTRSHVEWRDRVRKFVDSAITPNVHEWDENKAMPKHIFKEAAKAGLLACTVGVPWPTEYAGPGPEGFDYFHELILIDELSRCGSGGVVWGLFGGLSIGLPPVVNFASKPLRDRVVPACLSGEKVICLAISEPYAGSDVANIKCEAEKTPDGRHYIVNGEKKWITNGVFADYFTVAVRTGGKGMGGISLLLIERDMPGVHTQQMKCTGVWPSGTAYITFDDVKVPVENLIGAENQGFKFIMYNFNHERWSLVCQASRFARVCLEESFKFASKRATFGKKLLEHPVIRWKIAEMARQVEATHAQLESLTYQMNSMSKQEAFEKLGGPLALLKVQSTKVFEYCAREAAQIFGGSSYVRGGQGEKVERLYREVRAYAIPGGSEEIMLDLAVRQAMKAQQQLLKAKSKM